MAASEPAESSPTPAPDSSTGDRLKIALALTAVAAIGLYFFPLFHVVPLRPTPSPGAAPAGAASFDPVAAAAKIWTSDLPAAVPRALELKTLVGPLRGSPESAAKAFAKSSGLGAAYYFVRGSGKIVACERSAVRVALDGDSSAIVALRTGPIFGNTVRDGCGFLDVNAFPSLQEFNALSAELNALVEKHVLPPLRARAAVGATIEFAGCAEAPESLGEPTEPLLVIVPVRAEVK